MAIGPSSGLMSRFTSMNNPKPKKFRVNTKAPARKAAPNVTMKSRSMPKPHGIFDKAFSGLKIRKDMGD